MSSSGDKDEPALYCNDVPSVTINGVVPLKQEYNFHKEGCTNIGKTPFYHKECFRKRGKRKI